MVDCLLDMGVQRRKDERRIFWYEGKGWILKLAHNAAEHEGSRRFRR